MYWHFRTLERRAFRHADGVISVLPGIAQYAAQHGVAASRTAYIPNGIDPELYPHPPQPPPIATGHGGGKQATPLVIFACRCCHDPIREAKAGICVEPENPATMARAMIELRDLPTVERAAMGRRAHRYVLEHHDLSKTAKLLEAFLHSVV